MLPVALAIPTPPTTPTVWAIATSPPTRPRRATGTWSGMAATTAANIALRNACTPAQPRSITGTESATDSSSRERDPPAAPISTQGSRRPTRQVVRSENAPKTGLQTVDTAAPTPSTSDSTLSLWSGEMIFACSARRTWIGPNQPHMMPRLTSDSDSTQRAGGLASGSLSASRRTALTVTRAFWGLAAPHAGDIAGVALPQGVSGAVVEGQQVVA